MKDYLVRAIDDSGMIRVFAARTTNMVEKARNTHNSSPTSTAAIGRALTAATIMGSMMKNEKDVMTLKIEANGPIGKILMTSRSDGSVKGYADHPEADVDSRDDGKLDVRGVVGTQGAITVIKDLGLREPYVGQSEIISGEIAEDIAAYYAVSEQQPSAVSLGVLVDRDISVRAAGGYIIQLLPGVSDEDITKIENSLSKIEPISSLIDMGLSPEEIVHRLLPEFNMEILETKEIEYRCDCSREKMEKALKSIGREEIINIIEEDKGAELVCHFCNEKHNFTEEDLKKLI